jgi:hypothetical protein
MAHEVNCPHCGCPLVAAQDIIQVPEVEDIEILRREIDHLRATVARLRGAGFDPLHRMRTANPAASWPAPHVP